MLANQSKKESAQQKLASSDHIDPAFSRKKEKAKHQPLRREASLIQRQKDYFLERSEGNSARQKIHQVIKTDKLRSQSKTSGMFYLKE